MNCCILNVKKAKNSIRYIDLKWAVEVRIIVLAILGKLKYSSIFVINP